MGRDVGDVFWPPKMANWKKIYHFLRNLRRSIRICLSFEVPIIKIMIINLINKDSSATVICSRWCNVLEVFTPARNTKLALASPTPSFEFFWR